MRLLTAERFTTTDNIDVSTDAASESSHSVETHTTSIIPPLIIVGAVRSDGHNMEE